MFDLSRLGLPSVADAYGKKWLCVYYVSSDDENMYYVAVEAANEERSLPLPQPCSLIAVPKPLPTEEQLKARETFRLAREKAEKP